MQEYTDNLEQKIKHLGSWIEHIDILELPTGTQYQEELKRHRRRR
jgi:hypothetical protein